jgi:GAF domain-containing protein
MFGLGKNDTQLWQQILQPLTLNTDYHSRVDALLKTVCQLTSLSSCFLYLLDAEAKRFHLERSWLSASPEDMANAGYSLPANEAEYGTEAMLFSPPLDLNFTPETQNEQLVSTPIGQLYSIPLFLENSNGFIGLLQLGPLPGHGLSRQVKRALETIRFPLALAAQQARQKELLREELAALKARSEIGHRLMGSALQLDRFVSLLLDLVLTATKTDAGFIAIVNPDRQQLTIRAHANLPPEFIEQVDLSPQTGLFDWSLGTEGGALLIRDFDFAEKFNLRSILAVPLLENDEPLGIFALVNFESTATFDEHNLTLLESFAKQIKLVLHNSRLFHAFTVQYLETVKGLAESLDARQPHLGPHHQRVSQISATIARRMNLPPDEVEAITTAGLIHDVGMAGIVEVEGGFQADFEHPTIGASLIEALPLHPTVAGAVLTHHEWFDGWGFPRGLKGDEIPPGGRILAIAEFIVEMNTGNPLRAGWQSAKILQELKQRRGTQFDPHVTDQVIHLIETQKIQLDTIAQS